MAKNKGKNKTRGLTRQEMGRIELGSLAASVKRRATKQQWRRLVKQAHSKGFSINDYLDTGTPDALKPRTRKGIQRQAESTIAAAYKPAEQELSDRERQLRSIDEKRRLDNERFGQWLYQRHAELSANAQAASQQVLARQQAIQAEMMAHATQLQQGMQQFVNPTGQVSNPAQFSGQQDIAAAAAQGQQQAAAQREFTNQLVGDQSARQAAVQANNIAFMAAEDAKRTSETWKALSEVADEKQRLTLSKAADIAKEISRLLDNETTKAQIRSDQELAAESLGVKRDQLALDIAEAEETARKNRANEKIRRDQLEETRRMNRLRLANEKRRLELDWYRARQQARKARNGGSRNGRQSTSAQERFEDAYASLATMVHPRSKTGRTIDKNFARKHITELENLLIKDKRLTRKMAQAVVRAFLQKGGTDPGDFRNYTDRAYMHRDLV